MFSIRADLPYKTWKEFKDSGKELVVGTTGPGSNAYDMPLLLKEFAGANLRLVKGYAANSDILLAVERKEADAWAALATTINAGIDRGAVRALVRARAPVPGFNDLPIDELLTTDPIGKSLMAIRGIPLPIGRAFAVRPGTPADRVAILRDALAKTIADPELQAEAKKAKIDMNYIRRDEVAKAFDEMMNQSPQVIEAMDKYLQPERMTFLELGWSRRNPGRCPCGCKAWVALRSIQSTGQSCERDSWPSVFGCAVCAALSRIRASRFLSRQDRHHRGRHAVDRHYRSDRADGSRYLGRYIPGNPIVILRQMPGGAHLIATGYVYNVAEPDGLTVLAANPAVAMAQLSKVKSVRFDVRQFQWLGSTGSDGMMFAIRSDLPYKTFKDIQNAKEDSSSARPDRARTHMTCRCCSRSSPAPSCGCCQATRPMATSGSRSSARKSMAGPRSPAASGAPSSRASCARWCGAGRRSPGSRICRSTRTWRRTPIGRSLMLIRGTPLSIGRPYAVRPERRLIASRSCATPSPRSSTIRSFSPRRLRRRSTCNISARTRSTNDFTAMMNPAPEALELMGKYLSVGDRRICPTVSVSPRAGRGLSVPHTA